MPIAISIMASGAELRWGNMGKAHISSHAAATAPQLQALEIPLAVH